MLSVGTKVSALCRSASLEEGPAVTGQPVSAETSAVAEGPGEGAAAARHARTGSAVQAPGFRAVTYNILADQYASTEHAQTHLFGYCPSQCASKPMACHLCRPQHLSVTLLEIHQLHLLICSTSQP